MKKSLLSVIVATKNSERTIDACLNSIKKQTYKNIEIIVVDNNSADKTQEIARKYTKLVFNKGSERSAQRNFGALKSKGEFLLFIDSDMQLSKTVVADCIRQTENPKLHNSYKVVGGIIIPEESFGTGFWAQCKRLERSFYVGVDWIEAARFFPKEAFMELKGFDEKLISGEDWDLSQRIKAKYKISRIGSFIKHNEDNLPFWQLLKKKMYYGTKIRSYSSKKENAKDFKKQSSIIERYKLFLSQPFKLFKNPVMGVGMLSMKTCEFIAVGVGYLF